MSKGSPGSHGGHAGVNPERNDTGEGQRLCPILNPSAGGRAKPKPDTKPAGTSPRSGPKGQVRAGTATLSQVLGGGEARRAVLRQQEAVPTSFIFTVARRQSPGKEAVGEAPVPPARHPKAGQPAPPGAVRGAEGGRGRSSPARRRWPRGCRGWNRPAPSVRHGQTSHFRPPRGLPRSLPYRQPCHSLTDCFHAQLPNSQVFSSGCRYFPLFEAQRARPVRLATDKLGCLFSTTSKAESRSWPRQGQRLERDRDRGNSAAPQQVWGGRGESSCPGTERGETRSPRPEKRRSEQSRERRLAPACAAHRAGPGGGRQPRIPAGRRALCPAAARCNAGPRAGAFKEATEPVPTRLQPGDPAEQFWGSLTLARLSPGASGERDKL